MEYLLVLSALGLVTWLLKRSVDDRERLYRLESQYQDQLAYLSKGFAEQQQELARLKGMSLELLRAQTAVRSRLTQLLESAPEPRQLTAASPESAATPQPAAAEPTASFYAQPAAPTHPAESPASFYAQPAAPPNAAAPPASSYAEAPTPAVAQDWTAPPAPVDASAAELAAAVVAAAAGLHATPAESTPPSPGTAPSAASPHPEPTDSDAEPLRLALPGDWNSPPPSPGAEVPPPTGWPSPPPLAEVPLAAAVAEPPPKLTPSFDWETLVGVRGAAWLGAVALVIAGTLFAKYSLENDLIKPPLRIAFLIMLALGSLSSSEFFLRPRYAVTANAICGGGIAILYAALFSAHNLYSLVGLIPTFVLMALTTVTAALLSLRYGNMYIAVLGMLGGFATPLALSTGQDRPYGLFAYILMLDLGFLWLAVSRGWHRLALLNLVATLLIEAGWAGKFLSPDKMPIAVGVALVFAFLFLALPYYLRGLDEAKKREVLYGSATAGLLPFGFAWVLAAHPQYARNWPLLFGFVACLQLGLLWVAVRRWSVLALLALLATAATHALWDLTSLSPQLLPVGVGSALLLSVPFWAVPWVWKKFSEPAATLPAQLVQSAALGASAPLVLYCLLAAQPEYGAHWLLLFGGLAVSTVALLGLALRTSPIVALTTVGLTTLSLFLWTGSTLQPALLAPGLGVALVLTLLFLLAVALAPRLGPTPEVPKSLRRAAAIAAAAPLLLDCWLAAQPAYGSRWPLLFGSLACANACVLWLGVRHSPLLIRVGLGLTIVCHALWIGTTMTAAQAPLAMGLALLFGLPYLALPTLQKGPDGKSESSSTDATLAAVAPFALAFYLASTPEYAGRWALLFGFVAILDGVLIAMALWQKRAYLLLVATAATSLTQVAWATTALRTETLWGGTLCTLALAAALGAIPRLWALRQGNAAEKNPLLPEWSGLATLIGLVLFAAQLIQRGLGQPPWAFLLLLALATGLLVERSRRGGIAWTAPLGGLVLAVLVQGWFVSVLPSDGAVTELLAADVLLRNLSVPLLLAALLSVAAALRTSRGRSAPAVQPVADEPGQAFALLTWARVARDSEVGALLATLTALLGLVLTLSSRSVGSHPGLLFTALLLLNVLVFATVARQHWTGLALLALGITATAATMWQQQHFQPADAVTALSWLGVLYLFFLALPLAMLRGLPGLRTHRSLFFASGLAGPLFFVPLYLSWVGSLGKSAIGLLPVLQAALSLAALAVVQTLPQPGATAKLPAEQLARRDLGHRALLAAIALGFLATAIPLQLDRQWIAVAWALEAAAVWWLYRRLPHPGLKYFGLLLYGAVAVRLLPTPELLHYQARGLPVLNWLLYSYGVPCLCFLIGAAGLRPVESRYRTVLEKTFPLGNERVPLHALVSFAGLLLIFVLINLEIADAFSPGKYAELWLTRSYARDLTRSLAWGVYALVLLIVGMRKDSKALRYFSLGAMLLTIAKVFLYDLSNLRGLYLSLSVLGLAVSLILVSLLYQRFVFQNQARREKTSADAPPPAGGPPKGA